MCIFLLVVDYYEIKYHNLDKFKSVKLYVISSLKNINLFHFTEVRIGKEEKYNIYRKHRILCEDSKHPKLMDQYDGLDLTKHFKI